MKKDKSTGQPLQKGLVVYQIFGKNHFKLFLTI